jgi:hypothetical protein
MKFGKATISKVIVIVVFVLLFIFVLLPIYKNANVLGETAGTTAGKMVGTAVGSFKGITESLPRGLEAGKEEGLSAKDTKVEVQSSLEEINRLEVLVTSFKVKDYLKVGDKYAALYFLKADAVFTVDFSQTSITVSDDGNTLFIMLPLPEVTVYLDESSNEKAVEYSKKFFDGSSEDGFDAYINSMKVTSEEIQDQIQNDSDDLMRMAKESAENQIESIAAGVCVNGQEIKIVWED